MANAAAAICQECGWPMADHAVSDHYFAVCPTSKPPVAAHQLERAGQPYERGFERVWDSAFAAARAARNRSACELLICGPGERPHTIAELKEIEANA